ncbi:MAG: roadblock/LC7 domain-containing protein [Nocardioides sp.]
MTGAALADDHDADVLVLPQRSAEPPAGTEMDADIAASWDLWSAQIGHALLPVLERLATSLPGFSSAMICTADGFNLCSIGLDEAAVDRVSALTSSLHSIADAVTDATQEAGRPLDMVSLANGTSKTVVLAVRDLIVGQLLVHVTADTDTLGVLLVRARVAAESVRATLADS